MPNPGKSRNVPCKIEGCTSKARQRGRCKTHYKHWRKENPEPQRQWEPENRKPVPNSPYWYLWRARKDKGFLCEEWANSTDAFAQAIHPRPSGHALCRKDPKKLLGPDNFIWRPKIKRLEGENMTDYAKRIRTEQLIRFPEWDRDWSRMKNFGITREQYDEMADAQGHGCAICQRPETLLRNTKSKEARFLAVDHDHDTGAIRALLCFDCNVTLGRMGESIERLEAMIAYIKKHKPKPDLRIVSSQ